MTESLTTDYWNTTQASPPSTIFDLESWESATEIEPDLPTSITIIFIAIGTIGNVLVCLSFLLDKKLRNVTNYSLFSLAITDLLVNVVIWPSRILMYIYVLEPSSFPLCILYLVGDECLTSASALHICLRCVQRYFAIKNPLRNRFLTRRVVCIKILLVWLTSFLTVVPYLTIAITSKFPGYPLYCPHLLGYFNSLEIVLYIEISIQIVRLAVVVISFIGTSSILYSLAKKQMSGGIAGMIRTVGGNISQDAPDKSKHNLLQSEKRALIIVCLESFAFIMSIGPYVLVIMIYLIAPDVVIHPYIIKIVVYLTYMNSIINPILYIIFNKRFRLNFKKIILSICSKDANISFQLNSSEVN